MENAEKYERSDTATAGIVIGIIDIIAMIVVIAILCTANFQL